MIPSTSRAIALTISSILAVAGATGCSSHQDGEDGFNAPEITGSSADDVVPSTIAPEISIQDVVSEQVKKGEGADAVRFLEQAVEERVTDPAARAALVQQIRKYFDDATAGVVRTEPFPVLPFRLLGGAQAIFAGRETAAPASTARTTLDSTRSLADEDLTRCTPVRPSLVPAAAGLHKGGLPDPKTSDCALFRTQQLAAVLNDLALGERGQRSEITDGARRVTSVDAVVAYLLETGHTIRIENNRYFADFLGLWYDGKSVAAPVWINTGIAVPGGGTLTVPSPHAGYSFHIRGPKFVGSLEFFLGTEGGASFRPVSGMHRPRWAGERAEYTYSTKSHPEKVKETFAVAAALRARWSDEGAGKPLEGYGVLGVCTDSTSVIERIVEGRGPSLFPLARLAAPVDRTREPLDLKLKDAIAALPRDVQEFEPGESDGPAIARIRTTMPMPASELKTRYPTLADQLRRLP